MMMMVMMMMMMMPSFVLAVGTAPSATMQSAKSASMKP
jgi:hypothetical protein